MSWLLYRLGLAFRETGQALDRVGCVVAGSKAYLEPVYRHRSVMPVFYNKPEIDTGAFIAPSAAISGAATIGKGASVWYGAVVRGDESKVSIGPHSNLQDGVTVLSGSGQVGGHVHDNIIGSNVTIGHGATLMGATLEDETLIGMGATLLPGVTVEKGSMVAAGAVVASGTTIPSGQLWAGTPALFLRALKPKEASFMTTSADLYSKLSQDHRRETQQRIGVKPC